jgi:uncharacterized protein (UPF0276 family)
MQTTAPGVGIGLRREHFAALPTCEHAIGLLEIVPENFVGHGGRARAVLRACAERWPIAAHGVSLSLGGPDPIDHAYVRGLKTLLDELAVPLYTDHLCYASIGGISFHDLLPLPFSGEAVMHTARRIRELADALERPVAVENISYYATMPGSELDEGDFVRAVVEEADCGLLLDVNNAYVNARNHGLDPEAVLFALPLERTVHVHLAGHCPEDGRLVDDHGAPVDDAVWSLYGAVLARIGPRPTIVEWDTKIPPLARVLAEADRARALADEFVRRPLATGAGR